MAVVDTINPIIELTDAGELPYYRGFFEQLREHRMWVDGTEFRWTREAVAAA